MTSSINPYNIDGTYPIAGQDNNSQGFRDNFTNTKNNFVFAKQELEDLQAKVVLKGALVGSSLDNDMAGSVLKNASFQGVYDVTKSHGTLSGSTSLSFSDGPLQTATTFGNLVITDISGWPSAGSYAKFRLLLKTTTSGASLTLPASVTIGSKTIARAKQTFAGGVLTGTVITFTTVGDYLFEFSTLNSGADVIVTELTRSRNQVDDDLEVLGNISSTGTIVASGFIGPFSATAANISAAGAIVGNTITANSGITGNLVTAIQSNITKVGDLTSLTVVGNVSAGNAEVIGTTLLDGSATLSKDVNTPVTIVNTSVALGSTVHTVIVDPDTTLSSINITMPSSPKDGQRVTIGFGNTVTSVTHIGSGSQTLYGNLTTGDTSTFGTWVYRATNTTWYRIG